MNTGILFKKCYFAGTGWRLIVVIMLMLLAGIQPGRAQYSEVTDQWASVWLYNATAGKFTVLSTQGTLVLPEVFPEIPAGYDIKPSEIAVSPDGVSTAFALGSSKTGKQAIFEVIRAEPDSKLYELPASSQLLPRMVFHDTQAIREVGAEAYDPIFGLTLVMHMTANPDPSLAFAYTSENNFWTIAVYDPMDATGAKIVHKLGRTQAHDLNPELDWPETATLTLQTYQDDTVIFSLTDDQSGKLTSFDWDTANNTIQANPVYRTTPDDLDLLPSTDEVIWVEGDTLYVYDPGADETFPFFRAPGEILRLPRFVQNGERIAVVANGSIRVMNRDGSEVTTGGPPAESVIDMVGVPTGLVFLSALDDLTFLANFGLTGDSITPADRAVLWSSKETVSAQIVLAQSGLLAPSRFDISWARLETSG